MKSTPSPVTSKPSRLRVGLKDVNREEFSMVLNEHLNQCKLIGEQTPLFADAWHVDALNRLVEIDGGMVDTLSAEDVGVAARKLLR